MKRKHLILVAACGLLVASCGSLPRVRVEKPTTDPETGAVRLGVTIGGTAPAEPSVIDYTDPKQPVDVDAFPPGDVPDYWPEA